MSSLLGGAGSEDDWFFLPALKGIVNFFDTRKAKDMHAGAADSKFAMNLKVLKAGTLDHFFMGLDEYNGRPVGDNIEMQMKLEFDDDVTWTARNAGLDLETTLKTEWEFVVNPIAKKPYPGTISTAGANEAGAQKAGAQKAGAQKSGERPSREAKEIGEFMQLPMTKEAKLTRPEVIAVRLYTGPAYVPINKGLREGGRDRKTQSTGNFPVTCSVLNSAIRKLSQVTEVTASRMLYRGLSGVMLDGENLKHFVELGFSSASPNKEVALGYTQHHNGLPTLFEIEVGKIDNGACLKHFSQFPAEEEVCLPPLSNFELVDEGKVVDGICIFRVKLNVNMKARTLEELKKARKVAVQEFSRVLALDYQEMAGGRKSEQLVEVTKAEVDVAAPDFFNNNVNFWNVHQKLFEVYKEEMDEAAKEFEERASALDSQQWRKKVELLQRALKLKQRSAVGYNEAVAMSSQVVAALPLNVSWSWELELQEAEQSLVVGALQEHVELLIEAGGPDNFKRAVEVADGVFAVVNETKDKRKIKVDEAAGMAANSFRGHEKPEPEAGEAAQAQGGRGTDQEEEQAGEGGGSASGNQDLDLDVANALYWRARARVQLKQWDEALPDVEEAVRIWTAVIGEQDERVPRTLSLQGQIYFGKERFEEALGVHEKAKALRTAVFGENHLEVAASLSNISKALAKLRRVSEAKIALEQALKIQREHLGRRHKYVAFTEEAMGNLLKGEGSLGLAAEYFTEALATAKYLKDEPFTERLESSIAALDQEKAEMKKQAMAKAAEAEKLPCEQWHDKLKLLREALALIKREVSEGFKEALEMSERVVAVLPADVSAQTLNEAHLSMAMDALQEHVELLIERGGEENCQRAVDVADKCVKARSERDKDQQGLYGGQADGQGQGEAKTLLATALYWRARARVQLKQWDEALPDVEEAVRIRTALPIDQDEELPKMLSLQGQIYFGKERFEEALGVHEKAKALRTAVFGENHLEVAASLSNISKALAKLDRVSEAKIALEQALQIQRGHLGRMHKYVAFTEEGMGNLLKLLGRAEEATQYFQKALKTARKIEDKGFIERVQQVLKDLEA